MAQIGQKKGKGRGLEVRRIRNPRLVLRGSIYKQSSLLSMVYRRREVPALCGLGSGPLISLLYNGEHKLHRRLRARGVIFLSPYAKH